MKYDLRCVLKIADAIQLFRQIQDRLHVTHIPHSMALIVFIDTYFEEFVANRPALIEISDLSILEAQESLDIRTQLSDEPLDRWKNIRNRLEIAYRRSITPSFQLYYMLSSYLNANPPKVT